MMIDFALEAERNHGLSPREDDPRGLHDALPADHDDHPGRLAGALPLIFGIGGDARAAPAAGHHHRRRADRQPVADPVHHPGGLPLSRPPAPLGQPETRRYCTHGALETPPKKHTPRCYPGPGRRPPAAAPIGPDYQRPDLAVPAEFRKPKAGAAPSRATLFQRGAWWELWPRRPDPERPADAPERSNQTLGPVGGAVPPAGAEARRRAGGVLPVDHR